MGRKRRREVDLVVVSDVHLGTYGCHAEALLRYLRSIRPKRLILNGDVIDMWQFSRRYWPSSHMQVVKHITGLVARNVKVTYLTGNHDEMLRRFAGFRVGSFQIDNKVVLKLDGRKAWAFHGDVFDVTMRYSRWLAKLGAIGYDLLILLNTVVNWLLSRLGQERISLSKRVKNSVKSAVKFINDFENVVAGIAIENGHDFVICGHIHHPEMKKIVTAKGEVTYLNSGDWIENLTALEYHDGSWKIYRYHEDPVAQRMKLPKGLRADRNNLEIFRELVDEFLSPKK